MEKEITGKDTYLDRVRKLIPAEVSAGFLTINSLIPLDSDKDYIVLLFFISLVIICGLYMYKLEMIKNYLQILFVSLVAFPVWALNIAIARIEWVQTNTSVPACLLVIITLLMPLLVRGAP